MAQLLPLEDYDWASGGPLGSLQVSSLNTVTTGDPDHLWIGRRPPATVYLANDDHSSPGIMTCQFDTAHAFGALDATFSFINAPPLVSISYSDDGVSWTNVYSDIPPVSVHPRRHIEWPYVGPHLYWRISWSDSESVEFERFGSWNNADSWPFWSLYQDVPRFNNAQFLTVL